jgi:release factor glutamine methyltransferase
VDTVLERVRLRPEAALVAADIGTGCDALALALATLEPRFTRIYAVDGSADALVVARRNGARYHMDGRITWLEGDLLAPVPEQRDSIGRLLRAALPQSEIRSGRREGYHDHVIVAQRAG